MIHTICVHGVLQDAVGTATYGALVTRPTGAAVRGKLREVIAREPFPTTYLDFGAVGMMDFSCADEVIAKLLQESGTDGDSFVVLTGLNEEMWDAVNGVLCRQELSVVGQRRHQDTLHLLGWTTPDMEAVFAAVHTVGAGNTLHLAAHLEWTLDRTVDILQRLALRRLLHAADGTFRPLSTL